MMSAIVKQYVEEQFRAALATLEPIEMNVVARYLPSGHPEFEKQKKSFELKVFTQTSAGLMIQVNVGTVVVVAFTLSSYPACCAMFQLNYFQTAYTHQEAITEDHVKNVTNMFFDIWKKERENEYGSAGRTIRVLINFVEHQGGGYARSALEDVSKLETNEDKIDYPMFYKWAKGARKFQSMKLRNHNSSNIIHVTEVVV